MVFDPYGYDLSHQQPQPSDDLAAQVLLGVPQEARDVLWRGLRDAVEQAVDLWERTPAGVKRTLSSLTVQHAGKPYFDEAMLRQQSQANWHCLMGIELRLAAQALEALTFSIDPQAHATRLAEECARVGQLYSEQKRRANAWIAKALLAWELRLLRYRDSPVLAPLIYE
jgi:hypothetical protein